MQPDPRFIDDTGKIWTYVKLLSGELGYSKRGENTLRTYTMQDLAEAMIWRNLSTEDIGTPGAPTRLGEQVLDYLNFRAMILETLVRPNLMSRDQAKIEFERLLSTLTPECTLPMNKQKGEKRHYAYLTCMVNMLTEIALGGAYFDYDPRSLITITKGGRPVRTLSRWMDGVFPSIDNPVAIWEIKEYYGTTTFGSRVADGIYETMLDGLEIKELKQKEQILY